VSEYLVTSVFSKLPEGGEAPMLAITWKLQYSMAAPTECPSPCRNWFCCYKYSHVEIIMYSTVLHSMCLRGYAVPVLKVGGREYEDWLYIQIIENNIARWF